ncbi:hypothetical protein M422DRAFT_250362 [Sphaerobolus stellatus SS14]|uniref:Unplaced genomic scaffold SPHSTscaffold_33, whole genome shotgun sequence n=1 Tax=Sphaerobolus stellatus (strain SS14) TaxID=990650 RepID=A0A0C9VH07_SPHS4|nr:hypothetical protein M422DRAFT_250362 [Sphaerobolus stellatus SS14]
MSERSIEKDISAVIQNQPLSEDGPGIASDLGPGLRRQLKNRHIAMITIGGVIGTGLFLGTAGPLRNGGPVGLALGYIV